jgi:hypothetical protein
MLREVKDVIRVPVAMIKHRSDIIESVDDNDEIEWTEDPFEFKSQSATEGSPLIDLIKIQGPPSLRQKLWALCEEFSDIFDTAVRAEPADIPPMSIQIFARFRKHKIIVNPKKTELDLEEVEHVGHLVSHKSISFTKEKRQKIMKFERSRTHKEMLMYVGLVNYFHDHV